ncbi:SPOR domain-containing protein [Carboxylicivirga sediminis]|uniref:SPOR domain-containing protein n=1 Tax=Carboxylicivirga sediminis TaxID=2006564 RepID=A0A941F7C0_9BACT|nr:SPOR domain-containing protein [Carboxylicivirga sediminis]MBR8538161.1 SPOR domain-containing protein [Carboxylicivirga sediminis]
MRKLLSALAIVALLIGAGCKDEPAKKPQKPVKTAVVEKKVVADTVKKEEPKPVVKEVKPEPPKPADKYFLIAGSFASRNNADVFVAKLIDQGYNAQVIERPGGPNGEFYKVAYKSFYDRKEAYAELRTARNNEGRNDVWLLVKK